MKPIIYLTFLCLPLLAAAAPPVDAKAWFDFDAQSAGEVVGALQLGVTLDSAERASSLRAGGDGKVAVLNGGHIKLPSEQWNAAGGAASIYMRFMPAGGKLVPCGLFSMRRADQAAINLSVLSLNRVDTILNLLTAFPRAAKESAPLDGADAATRKGTFMNAPVEKLPQAEWFDVVFTRDGVKSQLFVNGALIAYRNMGGSYALAAHWFPPPMPKEGVVIGADLDGSAAFRGSMDHLGVWDRTLSDDEVRTLMGGTLDTSARQRLASTSDAYADGEAYLSEAFGEPGRLNATSRTMKTAFDNMRRDSKTFPLIHPAVPGDSYDIRGVRYGGGYHLFPAVFLGWWHTVRVPAMPYWGHLYSPDLVHWQPMPCPNVPVYNSNGAVVEHEGEAVVLGGWKVPLGSREGPGLRIARTRDPLLRSWAHDIRNPIATPLPASAGLPLEALRDTDAWFDAATKQWNIIATVPYGLRYKSAFKHHLYRSADLRDFTYIGPFHDAGKDDAGSEVPHVFPIGGKLVFSALRPLQHEPLENYQVGHVGADGRFVREGGGFWDHGIGGGHPHEFIGFAHRPDGSVIVWQAIRGFHTLMRERGIKALMADGWSVAYSLPRSVALKSDNTLTFTPAPELTQLRGEKGTPESITGGALELDAEVQFSGEEDIILEVGDAKQTLRLRYSPKRNQLHSERGTAKICAVQASAPLTLKLGEPLRLRVFADRGIVEVFFGDGQVMTNRILPNEPDQLRFTWKLPANTKLVKNDAWPLHTIWKER
jgi:beta-fructofuranosidase